MAYARLPDLITPTFEKDNLLFRVCEGDMRRVFHADELLEYYSGKRFDIRDIAERFRRNLQNNAFVYSRYITLGPVIRTSTRSYMFEMEASPWGAEAYNAVSLKLVWDHHNKRTDYEKSFEFWDRLFNGLTDPTAEIWRDMIENATHPVLSGLISTLPERHYHLLMRSVRKIESHTDPLFDYVHRLPDTELYRTVKREAFHQKMKVWTPA